MRRPGKRLSYRSRLHRVSNWKMENRRNRNSKLENRNSSTGDRVSSFEFPVSNFDFRVLNAHPARGYAFVVLMIAVTLLLISLTAALPSVYTAAQREKEEELIFRGNQYARAILMFRAKFGRFPNSVDELLKRTNGIRFLRHDFKDPMTKKGNWRFIHADARGVVLDSLTMPLATRPHGSALNPNSGLNPNPQVPGANPDSRAQPAGPPDEGTGNQTGSGGQSAFSNQMMGGFIVGVASTSHKNSIRVWNNKSRYDEWEFLGVQQGTGGSVIPGQPMQPTGTGQNPGLGTGGGPQVPNLPPLVGPSNPQ
jgi:type II secretory pathway pseudopilin PulG